MVAIKALTVLALAGSITAAPVAQSVGEALVRREAYNGRQYGSGRWSWHWGKGGGEQSQSSDSSAAPAVPATAEQTPPAAADSSAAPYTPPASSGSDSGSDSGASAPAASAPSTGSSGGSGYIAIVNEWRGKMGLPSLTQDSTLEANAIKTSKDAGTSLTHELNPGSMAQVLAPGDASNFESVFVGGWLCEVPSLPGLGSSVCNSASQGWDHGGQTGHADILSSTTYTKIGCGLDPSIWACDLA